MDDPPSNCDPNESNRVLNQIETPKVWKKKKSDHKNRRTSPIYSPSLNSKKEDLLVDFGDEPAVGVEKLITYICSKFKPPKKILRKIENLNIQLKAPVEPIHQGSFHSIESNYEEQYDTDSSPYTHQEEAQLITNWENFCKEYGFPMDSYPWFMPIFCESIYEFPKGERRKFIQYLAHGLSNRSTTSVYRKFQVLLMETKRGRFTPAENDLIIFCYENMSNKNFLSICSKILYRPRQHIHRRLLRLLGRIRMKDTQLNLYKFMVGALVYLKKEKGLDFLTNDNSCSKDFKYPSWASDESNWNLLKNLTGIGVTQLKLVYFARVYPGLHGLRPCSDKRVRKRLFSMIKLLKVSWAEFPWLVAGKKIRNLGPVFLYHYMRDLVRTHVPKEMWGNLTQCVLHLSTKPPAVFNDDRFLHLNYVENL